MCLWLDGNESSVLSLIDSPKAAWKNTAYKHIWKHFGDLILENLGWSSHFCLDNCPIAAVGNGIRCVWPYLPNAWLLAKPASVKLPLLSTKESMIFGMLDLLSQKLIMNEKRCKSKCSSSAGGNSSRVLSLLYFLKCSCFGRHCSV